MNPDSVVLSHPDGGHIANQPLVCDAFPIKQVLLPVELARSPAHRSWLKAADSGAKIYYAGNTAELGFPDGAKLEVLHAPPPRAQNMIADNRVAIYRLHWREWTFLFMSDAGDEIERQLLQSGKNLGADVIVVGKHPTDSHLGDEFLDAVSPQVIVASNASYPAEERLDLKRVDYWISRGIRVINQGITGGVTIRVGENGDLWIKGFVDRSQVRLTH